MKTFTKKYVIKHDIAYIRGYKLGLIANIESLENNNEKFKLQTRKQIKVLQALTNSVGLYFRKGKINKAFKKLTAFKSLYLPNSKNIKQVMSFEENKKLIKSLNQI
jgi:hypothetical protein